MSKKKLKKAIYKPLKKKFKKEWPHLLKLLLVALGQIFSGLQQQKASSPKQKQGHHAPSTKPATGNQAHPPHIQRSKIIDSALNAKLEQAAAYHQAINRLIQASASPTSQVRLNELAEKVRLWTEAIEHLVRRVDHYKHNQLIQQEFKTVPQSIATLQEKMKQEQNPMILDELEKTLARRHNQRDSLEKVRQMMAWAEIKIESTLSLLGTIHSQLLTSQSQHDAADYSRLLTEVDEEVHLLQDHLEALDEVKLRQ